MSAKYTSSRLSPRRNILKSKDKFSPKQKALIRKVTAKPKSSTASANVKVVVRVRPPNDKEIGSNSRTVVKIASDNLVFDPKEDDDPFFFHGFPQRGRDISKKACKNIQFQFDRVFGYESNNSAVFDESTKNLLPCLMDGYNCSVFVYGATGAGKTHTMLGSAENPGITYLTMRALFDQIEKLQNEREFELAITYLEVYNEQVKDLLNPGTALHLREDGKYCVFVAGIKLHRIKNAEELFTLLRKGNANRTQHPTDANAESSRSHAVFQVYVDMSTKITGERRFAKLSMIDLAGSERGAATGCTGMRFTEGANINKSLLALGNCINSLADGHSHIPYRDSKLTRLLKDSLGGNCQTVMIANISPSFLNYEDTYNTLKYATRAKKIKSNTKKNVVTTELTVPQYMKLVENLNKEIDNLKSRLNTQELDEEEQITIRQCTCRQNKEIVEEIVIPAVPTLPVPVESPVWQEQLGSILKDRISLQKQLMRLKNSQEIIQVKVKSKDYNREILTHFGLSPDQLDTACNRIIASVGTFERQSNSVHNKLQNVSTDKLSLDEKLKIFLDENQIPNDCPDLLKNEIELQKLMFDLQEQHKNEMIKYLQNELNQKNRVEIRMADNIRLYYQLLRAFGHITEEMAEEYRSTYRLAQGIRPVTWQDMETDDPQPLESQDSGISLLSEAQSDLIVPEERTRTPLKRKLFEIKSSETSSTTTSSDTEDYEDAKPNLNETITIPSPKNAINTDIINNTFNLNTIRTDSVGKPGKKRPLAAHRTNVVSAENILPRAFNGTAPGSAKKDRTVVVRPHTAATRTQRFPLRNHGEQAATKTVRTAKQFTTTTVNRINPTAPKRFKL